MTTTTAVPSSDVSDFVFNVQKLDEIATGTALTYVDRLGVERSTAAGVMARFAALNPRGAWATATVYQSRDLVLQSGTWYIALDTHTSGATFAGDLLAHWRPEQGVTRADLADPTSASNGSGLVKNNATLNYVPGSLGARATERISICDYPYLAVGDGALTTVVGQPIGAGTGTDNYAAIMAAHDGIVARGKPALLVIPPGVFRCDTGLKINASFVTLAFEGGALDFRNIGNGVGIQIYSTAQYKNRNWCIGSGAIYGPRGSISTNSKALFFESNSGGVGSADIAEVCGGGIDVYHFAYAVYVGNNAYIIDFSQMKFWFQTGWFFYCPSGLSNTGQRWSFSGCAFLNGVNGFFTNEATMNLELNNPVIVPTGGVAFAPESGYIVVNGGGIEVDASTGAQFIKNTNAGAGSKSTFIGVGMNLLYKNSTTQPFISLESLNTYVKLLGGHASVAAGSVFFSGASGSGQLVIDDVLADGALDPATSGTLGAGFSLIRRDQPFTGNSTQTGTHRAAGLISTPVAGGSVAALNGNSSNQVAITGTYTTLFTSSGCFLVLVRDNTAGGCALLIYDAGSGVIGSIYNNIAATVQFQHTGTALQARTTAGTANRTMIVFAIKV